MPILRHSTTRTFTRITFAGILETVTLLKRGDDQQEGTVTSYKLFQCRRSLITKKGEPIAGDVLSDHRCIWHIPRREMDRIGIQYLTPDDQIIDSRNRVWQPEGQPHAEVISDKLFENEMDIQCVRVPPVV